MKKEEIVKNLKELRKIIPEKDYVKKSKFLILKEISKLEQEIEKEIIKTEKGLSSVFNFIYSHQRLVGLAVLMIFVIIVSIFSFSPLFDQKELFVEADEINTAIELHFKELKYVLDKQPILTERSVENINTILEEAKHNLEEAYKLAGEGKIEEVVKKIKKAQELVKKLSGE